MNYPIRQITFFLIDVPDLFLVTAIRVNVTIGVSDARFIFINREASGGAIAFNNLFFRRIHSMDKLIVMDDLQQKLLNLSNLLHRLHKLMATI